MFAIQHVLEALLDATGLIIPKPRRRFNNLPANLEQRDFSIGRNSPIGYYLN